MAPSCTQCMRARVECPGYRDASTVCFRDETERTAQKVQRQNGRRNTLSAVSLCIRPDEILVKHFLVGYAPSGSFSWLPLHYASVSSDVTLQLALQAAALASISQESHQPKPLLEAARTRYAKAISRINAALNDPNQAIQDSTITAVLLMGLFEALVFKGRAFPARWTAHVEGSAALLKLRSDDQHNSPLGRRLFHHAITNIRTSYAQRGVPVPRELSLLGQSITHPHSPSHLEHEDLKAFTRVAPLVDAFAELRSAQLRLGATAASAQNSEDPVIFIQKCLDLDNKLRHLIDEMPQAWHPTTEIPSPEADHHAYKGIMHSFTSPRVVRQRNILHMLRLWLSEWIVERTTHASGSDSGSDGETETAAACHRTTAEDSILHILASVPFMISKSYGMPSSPAARFLIWPLNTVGVSVLASAEARMYVRRELGFLGREFNLPQAEEAARVVEERVFRVEDW